MQRTIKGKYGAMIAVEDIGEGQPLIFLHGWPFNQRMFEYQYNYFLPRGYRIIGIDFRGFGGSDLVIEGYGYDTLADDIHAVISELALEDAVMIGFQMGGAVAARYFTRHNGQGISKLILMSAAVPALPKKAAYLYGLKKDAITEIVNEIQSNRPKMIQEFVTKMFHEKPVAAYKNWLHSLALDANSYAMILAALLLREEEVGTDLPQINVPTFIAHGEKDRICPLELTAEMNQLIPQSLVMRFRKSGHAIFHDELDKLNEMMHKFIQNRAN